MPGEFLVPTSARTVLAFEVQAGWAEVALRANGFSMSTNAGVTVDEEPVDMEIARFTVSTTVDDTFKLPVAIGAGTPLRTNPALTPATAAAAVQEDLRPLLAPVIATSCTKTDLETNGVVVPSGALMTDYAPQLTGGPSIDGNSVHWMPDGPFQPTPDNTRYVNLGDVVEWSIENTTGNAEHPWHLHGFSFQPIRMELNTGAGFDTLYDWDFVEYVDSIYVPAHHRLVFRFRVSDRPYVGEDDVQSPNGAIGRWLAHCHITKHAHRGMMMNFIVVDACSTSTFQHVDVYLRDQIADNGTEPTVGTVSASPDIIMRPFASADPNADFGAGSGTENDNTLGREAEFGQDNFIYVRASNRGAQPAIATADVYWAEGSTLLTPDNWNYIGTTDPMTVNPGVLTVSNAVVWHEADNPLATGAHACLIAVVGSQQDPKPITPNEAASFPTLAAFEDFRQFVRDRNNVAWRNFNVVDDILNFDAEKFFPVTIRGAFDRDRLFDLVIRNPFEKVQLELPNDDRLSRMLSRQDLKHDLHRGRIIVELPPREEFRITNLDLAQGRNYRSRLIVHDDSKSMLGETLQIAQVFVDDHQDSIQKKRKALARVQANLRGAENDMQAEMAKKRIGGLTRELVTLGELARQPEKFRREEVGRVSWHFVEPRDNRRSSRKQR